MTVKTSGSSDLVPDVIRVDRPVLRLGRDASVDVRIAHPGVSRVHAEIHCVGGRLSVRDLGSRAGVWVNNVPAAGDTELNQDDQLLLGPVAFVVKGLTLRRLDNAVGIHLSGEGLTYARDGVTIVSDARLNIPPNSFVAIIGPSGCGKTTLLKGLTGFLPAIAGRLLYDGVWVSDAPEMYPAVIGFVPQEDVLHGELTVRENLEIALRLRVTGDLLPAERHAWVDSTLSRLSLTEHGDQLVRKLSGGQRKRVSVGVELLTRPRLMLLDEPSAGLDPANDDRLMRECRDLAKRGTTIICTTHVLATVDLFDMVVVMAGGRVLGGGSPSGLLAHFGATDYAGLYQKLEKTPPPAAGPSAALPSSPRLVESTSHAATRPIGSFRSQFQTLFQRDAMLVARDRTLVALLIGQPLMISALVALSQCNPMDLNLLFTFAAVSSVWLGLNNTAREIVRDRAIYVRERRAGLNPAAYLVAKVATFSLIGLIQVMLMTFVLRFCNLLTAGSQPAVHLSSVSPIKWLLVLWVTYSSAMLLGLLISTLSHTEDVAVASLPLVILPQLLLSGVAANLLTRQASYFAPLGAFGADGGSRRLPEWLLELASLLSYTRPSLVFFLDYDKPDLPRPGLADVAHLLFLLLLTGTLLVAVFASRERRWLQTA